MEDFIDPVTQLDSLKDEDIRIRASAIIAMGKTGDRDAIKSLIQILENRFDLLKNETVSQIPSLMGEVQRDPVLKALWLEKFLQPFLGRIEMGYRVMTASGKFRRLEPAVAVRVVGGMFFGFLMIKIMEGESSPLNRLTQDTITNNVVDLVLHGLLNDTGDKKPEKDGAI